MTHNPPNALIVQEEQELHWCAILVQITTCRFGDLTFSVCSKRLARVLTFLKVCPVYQQHSCTKLFPVTLKMSTGLQKLLHPLGANHQSGQAASSSM